MDGIQRLNATVEVVFVLNPELDFVVDADTLKREVKCFHRIFNSTSGHMRIQGMDEIFDQCIFNANRAVRGLQFPQRDFLAGRMFGHLNAAMMEERRRLP